MKKKKKCFYFLILVIMNNNKMLCDIVLSITPFISKCSYLTVTN